MEIPDGEILYRYVKPAAFPENQQEMPAHFFNDPELSCDWEKIQRHPEQSLHIQQGRNMIVSIRVCDEIRNPRNPKRNGEIVAAWVQKIIHDPLEETPGDPFTPNEAHSLIKGKKKAAVVSAIRNNATARISLQLKYKQACN
ncbi:MAG: hypothetical protein LGR52_10875 [Candidatus Thiosymbion ectosymbiont of Robbea hypermnestra]|nr:hypothetical protein [Candidatus Thiosymbion ectosymbiont of Robbea hypermnestra]